MADAAGTVNITITAVAKVGNTYYATLEDAFANDGGQPVILLTNVETASFEIDDGNTHKLDLNGSSIGSTSTTVTVLDAGTSLEISGEGSIISEHSECLYIGRGTSLTVKNGIIKTESPKIASIFVNGAVTISGGTIISQADAWEMGAVFVTESVFALGTATITGGNFIGGLKVGSLSTATISGGTFSSVTPGGESVYIQYEDGKIVLGEGKAFHNEAGLPIKPPAVDEPLTGTVTVKDCEHNNPDLCEYTHTTGTTTHSMTCLACGKDLGEKPCNLVYTSINETQHKITCDLCGREDTGAHDFEFSAEGDSTSQECKKTCKICPYEKSLGTYSITPDFEVPFDQTRGKTLTVTAPAGAQLTNIRWYVDGATDPAPNINGMTFTLYLMRPF